MTVKISLNQHYCVASTPSSAGACFLYCMQQYTTVKYVRPFVALFLFYKNCTFMENLASRLSLPVMSTSVRLVITSGSMYSATPAIVASRASTEVICNNDDIIQGSNINRRHKRAPSSPRVEPKGRKYILLKIVLPGNFFLLSKQDWVAPLVTEPLYANSIPF